MTHMCVTTQSTLIIFFRNCLVAYLTKLLAEILSGYFNLKLGKKYHFNLYQNTIISRKQIEFENADLKMAAILYPPDVLRIHQNVDNMSEIWRRRRDGYVIIISASYMISSIYFNTSTKAQYLMNDECRNHLGNQALTTESGIDIYQYYVRPNKC